MTNITYSKFPNDNNAYVFMVRSYGFLARCIRLFMRLKQKALHKSTVNICNHADIYVGQGVVVGAIKQGIYPKSITGMYDDGKHRDIFVYQIPIDSTMHSILYSWVMNESGKKYEFDNFFNHIYRILYIILKGKEKWIGNRGQGARRVYYCSEFVSTAISQVIPEFSKSPWDDDPMDLKELCENKLKYITTINM